MKNNNASTHFAPQRAACLAEFTAGMEALVFNTDRNRSGLTAAAAAGKTGNIKNTKIKEVKAHQIWFK